MANAGGDRGRSSPTVLVADPDAESRASTERILESADDPIAVETAATAADLQRRLSNDGTFSDDGWLSDDGAAYACVVTEYDLGDTDALSVFETHRADWPSIPFVLYTDEGSERLASEALAAGLSGYVPKDDDGIELLLEQVRVAIDAGENDADASDEPARGRELERYRTLVETVGDPMYVLDEAGRIEMVNDAMANGLGASRDEIVGKPATAYMPVEDVEHGTNLLLTLLEDDDRDWATFEMTVDPPNGESYVAEDNVAPLVEDGELVGSVGVVRDISDRKERERRIRELHDGTRRLMAAESVDEVTRVATEIARDALDLPLNGIYRYDESADALVPASVTDETVALLGDVPTIEPGGGLIWDAYEAGMPIAHGDVGHAEDVRNPRTEIRSEAHIPLGEAGVFVVSSTESNDFDEEALALAKILAANVEAAIERARREGELADRTRELERQNERLDQFASSVSHDLRNPLTLASGHAELLEPYVADEGRDHLAEINWAIERMDDLIEDVLTLARSGQRVTDTESVDLDRVVEQAHRTVDPDLEVVTDALPTVDADEGRLLVCVENLLRNAREHAGDGVTVTIVGTEDGFALADDGPGIPADERDDVFDLGYTTADDGTGFGLAIVAEVVEGHGWTIDVGESADGGARFDVTVPGGAPSPGEQRPSLDQ